ncbi:CaiB/BaiF CoA-transferase family protein [Bacillaceae bacterium IKA-2]|nr:CaiB/BaiF CoA-transferase family protein [Bacillaceae bacterium IKA-2]
MLTGIRIIDFSKYLPGPYATMRLADKGAEVIVIEPMEGEPSRHLGIKQGDTSLLYLANNRNKKSIAINLKEAEGQKLALELIKIADVVVESFRPGVMKRLGLDYETVKKVKEDIIYCSISGYGQQGEMSNLGSHDLNYLAISGVLAQLKDDQGKPILPSVQLADHIGAFNCTEEILAALLKRSNTKTGSYIDLSLVDPLVSIMGTNYVHYHEANQSCGVPQLTGGLFCYSIYETKDGRYVALAALEVKFWRNFCAAIGKLDWLPMHGVTKKESAAFLEEITLLFKSKPLHEWALLAGKTDCCLTPILEVGELDQFPFLKDRQLISREKTPTASVATYFSQDLKKVNVPPQFAGNTETILQSLLGYSAAEIERLSQEKILKCEDESPKSSC